MQKHNKYSFRFFIAITACMLLVLACGIRFSSDTEDKLQTAVAGTMTAKPPEMPTLPVIPTDTETPAILLTATLTATDTAIPKPCNQAQFISETIPDNTVMDPNEAFTKTWRFKNIGTCTWNTSYKLVFSDGNKLSGTSPKNFSQSVAPSEQVDIAVDLKAPASGGTYKGYWKLQDDSGNYFVNSMWVQIKVSVPMVEKTVTLSADAAESGSVWESGSVNLGDLVAGDAPSNAGIQNFAAFKISGIPSSANILSVKMDFSDYAVLGSPFGLGCLRMYEQGYRPLNAGDYFTGSPSGALSKWCSIGELNSVFTDEDVVAALQNRLGSSYFPLRFQFNETESDNDGVADAVGWNAMELIVKYEVEE